MDNYDRCTLTGAGVLPGAVGVVSAVLLLLDSLAVESVELEEDNVVASDPVFVELSELLNGATGY